MATDNISKPHEYDALKQLEEEEKKRSKGKKKKKTSMYQRPELHNDGDGKWTST